MHSYLIKLGNKVYLSDALKIQWSHDQRIALEFDTEKEAETVLAHIKRESGLYEARVIPNTMLGVGLIVDD